jgi:hypothetical protein
MDFDPAYDFFFFTYHLISCIGYFRGGDRGLSTLSLAGSMQTVLILYTPSQAVFASLGVLLTPLSLFQGEVFGSAIHLN